MGVEWMGRYRPLVRALVQHTNTSSRNAAKKREMLAGSGIYISSLDWQMLEYLVEHENEDWNMLEIAESLGLAQSSLSKYAKSLEANGLIERYHVEDNRKNIILKPTEKGKNFYETYSRQSSAKSFKPLFDGLESISDEDLACFVKALEAFNRSHYKEKEKKLIRIQPKK